MLIRRSHRRPVTNPVVKPHTSSQDRSPPSDPLPLEYFEPEPQPQPQPQPQPTPQATVSTVPNTLASTTAIPATTATHTTAPVHRKRSPDAPRSRKHPVGVVGAQVQHSLVMSFLISVSSIKVKLIGNEVCEVLRLHENA